MFTSTFYSPMGFSDSVIFKRLGFTINIVYPCWKPLFFKVSDESLMVKPLLKARGISESEGKQKQAKHLRRLPQAGCFGFRNMEESLLYDLNTTGGEKANAGRRFLRAHNYECESLEFTQSLQT